MNNNSIVEKTMDKPEETLTSFEDISTSEIYLETIENNDYITENDIKVMNNRRNKYHNWYEENMIPGKEIIKFHEDSIEFNGIDYMRESLDSGDIDNKNIALGNNGEKVYTFTAAQKEAEKVGLKVPSVKNMIDILNCLPPSNETIEYKEGHQAYLSHEYKSEVKKKLKMLDELLLFKEGSYGEYRPGSNIHIPKEGFERTQSFWTSTNDDATQEQLYYNIDYSSFISGGVDDNDPSMRSSLRALPVHCIKQPLS